jgi:hypothetical protein
MRFFIRLPRVDKRRPSRRATRLPAGTRVGDDAVAAVCSRCNRLSCPGCPCATATVLAMGQPSPTTIVSDGVNVYWVNNSPNGGVTRSVMKVPVGGGTPVPVATNLLQPMYLAVDATHAYWTDAASTFPNGTFLMSAPLRWERRPRRRCAHRPRRQQHRTATVRRRRRQRPGHGDDAVVIVPLDGGRPR